MRALNWEKGLATFGLLAAATVVLAGLNSYSVPLDSWKQFGERQQQTTTDWKAIELAIGRPGLIQPGDVFRVELPMSDLNLTLREVAQKPSFELDSYASFKQMGSQAIVIGNLVLMDDEVDHVVSGLLESGFNITKHPLGDAPHVSCIHFWASGDATTLARELRAALDQTNSVR